MPVAVVCGDTRPITATAIVTIVATVTIVVTAQPQLAAERHLGSLTCHVLRSKEKEEVYSHFLANSSTVFSK